MACKICKKDTNRCKCIPEDLGIKIGTKEEVFWTDAKTKLENNIMMYTESLIGDKIMLELANKRIKEEKTKMIL